MTTTEEAQAWGAKFIEEMEDGDVEHYGVKGMRWGVRRTDKQLKRAAAAREEASSGSGKSESGGKSSRGNIGKKSSTLSDKELKDVVNRMNLERQYAALQPKSFSKQIADTTKQVLASAAKQQMQQVVNQQMSKQIGSLMSEATSRKSGVPRPPNRFPSAPPNPDDRVG